MPPPIPARARLGAVEAVTAPAQQAYLKRRGKGRAAPRWAQKQGDWQTDARAFAQFNGAAAFNAMVISDLCARCDIFVEQRDFTTGDWIRSNNPGLQNILAPYHNKWQSSDDLIRAHAWRYQVDAEGYIVSWDGERGVEYGVFSVEAVDIDKPKKGQALVRLIVEGKPESNTALILMAEQAARFWIPHPEELLRAASPMMSSIEDLNRLRALTRDVTRNVESRLAMDGMFFVPAAALGDPPPPVDDDGNVDSIDVPRSDFEEHYYDLARLSLTDDDDVTAIAPAFGSYDGEKPEWIQIGRGLDPVGMEHRKEALNDAARPWPVPNTSLEGGGVGDANHWSEWLASAKFVDSGVRPTMDRITHQDLTELFLYKRLEFEGWAPADILATRIGYDATPIIVKTDRSTLALEALKIGAIGYTAAREAGGWDDDDKPTPDDVDQVLAFLAGKKAGEAPPGAGPVSGGNVSKLPPVQPTTPPASNGNGQAPAPAQVAALLASVLADYADADAH